MANDIKAALKEFRSLGEKAIQRASARALNRVGTSVRAEASRRVRETLNLKAADAKEPIGIARTKGSIAAKKQRVEITISQKGVPLFKYGARDKQVKTVRGPRFGVTVKVLKQGKRKLVRGGFIAGMRSGHTGIFVRKGKDRLPIKGLFSMSARDVFKNKDIVRAVLGYGRALLGKELRAQLNYELQKTKQK